MDETARRLGHCRPFADLPADVVRRLAGAAITVDLEDGEYLFREGEVEASFYLVQSGQLELRREAMDVPRRVAVIDAGHALCEEALLQPSLHSVSARAKGEVTLLELPGDTVRTEMLGGDTATLLLMAAGITASVTDRLKYTAATAAAASDTFLFSRETRLEHDLLGERDVPADALYGIQTLRAVENFPVTGIRLSRFPTLVRALARVKQAAARANRRLGLLPEELAQAIEQACQEIVNGVWHGHFVVDMVQGGAGTSTNMNANEVIANRALELLGYERGDYEHCHPNNHVNLAQSTNDAYPTALRIASVFAARRLAGAMRRLQETFAAKAREVDDVLKMGRTQLQDAVPMTLGQELRAFAVTIGEDVDRLEEATRLFYEINLGGTAIGTGINAEPEYRELAVEELARLTDLPLVSASDLVEATHDTGAFVMFSGVLKRIAVKLSKICNDLRLLSSGPRCGFNKINLPPMQPGSSIMPGKVNPVIPEMVNQVAFQVVGNDLTVTMAAEAGQLQLNVMEPIIALSLFQSQQMLSNAIDVLGERCVVGITANRDRCRELVEGSVGIITAVVPAIGYEAAGRIAKEALQTGRPVRELVVEHGLLSEEDVDELLAADAMVQPRRTLTRG